MYQSDTLSPSPGGDWGLLDYEIMFEGAFPFEQQNFQPGQEFFASYDPTKPMFTEVEAAIMICPKPSAVEGEEGSLTPRDFELYQNFPNPFNNQTIIKFNLRRPAEVTLTIYNILGQKVKTLMKGRLNAGAQTVSWDGKDDKGNDLSSGIYFYQLRAGKASQTKRLLLLK